MPRYSWNVAKVSVKHQSINQSIRLWLSFLGPLGFLLPNTRRLLGFPVVWPWANLMKVILEGHRVHYIWYLRFFYYYIFNVFNNIIMSLNFKWHENLPWICLCFNARRPLNYRIQLFKLLTLSIPETCLVTSMIFLLNTICISAKIIHI